jgi:CubicO group peptidase (beta-lactamase class C family)
MPTGVQSTNERIERAFEIAVDRGEQGIQIAAYLGDELIADAWTGLTDPDGGTPVDGDTLFPVFSVTKAMASLAVHLQVERGYVDYDAPVATYWPEYGTKGKDAITVRQVLTHRAGVPQIPAETTVETLCDWDWMTARLAEMEPLFTPGSTNTYLSYAYGWLVGMIVQGSDPARRGIGQFIDEEICRPLKIDAFWIRIGLPEKEDHRVARLFFPEGRPPQHRDALRKIAIPEAVEPIPEVFNRTEIRRACLPFGNGIGNARSCARFFAMLAQKGELDGVRLLSEARVLSFLEPRPEFDRFDACYGKVMPVGAGGFLLNTMGILPEAPRVLCGVGAGNSVAWADLDTGLALAICHNRMTYYPPSPPLFPLGGAIQATAGELAASRQAAADVSTERPDDQESTV